MNEQYHYYANPTPPPQYTYQPPVYQQPVCPAPPAQGSATPCAVSLATGIGGFILTGIGLSCVTVLFLFSAFGLFLSGFSKNASVSESLATLWFSLGSTAAVLLIAAVACTVISMVFGIKGISQKRRLRPMAIVGVVFSGLSVLGLFTSLSFTAFLFM